MIELINSSRRLLVFQIPPFQRARIQRRTILVNQSRTYAKKNPIQKSIAKPLLSAKGCIEHG
jgi:hypothetical protein